MPLRSFAHFKLIMSRHRKELRGALGHCLFGLCVNPSLHLITAQQGKKENCKFAELLYITKIESFLAYFMHILNSCVV